MVEVIKFSPNGQVDLHKQFTDFFEAEDLYIDMLRLQSLYGNIGKSSINVIKGEQITSFNDGTIIKLVKLVDKSK